MRKKAGRRVKHNNCLIKYPNRTQFRITQC
uniref:Uncharacterized protein n=1 Tax=Rhizophora mucronata TaxID=61149 RepID=A0A2P2NBF1_RHIMU